MTGRGSSGRPFQLKRAKRDALRTLIAVQATQG